MTSSHLAPPTREVGEGGAATGSSAYSADVADVSRDQVTIDSHTKKTKKQKTKSKTFTANRKEKLFLI